jgi:hypothetical protein
MYQETGTVLGTVHGGMGVAAQLTVTTTNAILIAFTLNAATAPTDISLWNAFVNAMN